MDGCGGASHPLRKLEDFFPAPGGAKLSSAPVSGAPTAAGTLLQCLGPHQSVIHPRQKGRSSSPMVPMDSISTDGMVHRLLVNNRGSSPPIRGNRRRQCAGSSERAGTVRERERRKYRRFYTSPRLNYIGCPQLGDLPPESSVFSTDRHGAREVRYRVHLSQNE